MPVLQIIRKRFIKERPLEGVRISACLHVTTETANLAITLRDGGADVVLCASNPLSTQDDVAASLVKDYEIPTYAIKGEDKETYYSHIVAALDHKPQITMDDGADLVTMILTKRQELVPGVMGGTEETTTGVIRLRSMAKDGMLKYPIVAVNDADTKHFFDNRYGTGQSTIDGILRATNLLFAGHARGGLRIRLVRARRGHARQRAGLRRDHYRNQSHQGAGSGDGWLPRHAAGRSREDRRYLRHRHGKQIRGGGRAFPLDEGWRGGGEFRPLQRGNRYCRPWKSSRVSKRQTREFVDEYTLRDGRKIYVLGEGRLINLAAAEGHPAVVMDMSFADQALSVEYMVKNAKKLEPKVYPVPADIDQNVARLKLQSLGINIDKLTREQEEYLASWSEGT